MRQPEVRTPFRFQPHGCACPKGWKIIEDEAGNLVFVPDKEDK